MKQLAGALFFLASVGLVSADEPNRDKVAIQRIMTEFAETELAVRLF